MRPSRHTTSLLSMILGLATAAAACTGTDARSPIRGSGPTPREPITLDRGPSGATGGRVPGGGSGMTPISLDSGFFSFTGPTVPGTGSFTNAVVWDPFASDMPPFGSGGVGAMEVDVSGTHYSVADADGFVARYTDDTGTEYLILSAFSEASDGAGGWVQTNLAVFVLASDFAPHTTVALDGIDRVAIFASGPESAPEPTVFAAAITGSVTFGDGSSATGDRLAATLTADFAPAESVGPPDAPGGVPLVAGDYDLVIEPTPEVFCGDSMAGHEASFAAETLAALGTTDGAVALSLPSEDTLALTGATLGAAWGDPVVLDALASPPDTYFAAVDLAGAGPDATELAGAYLLVEGRPDSADLAHAAIGLAYVDPAADGGCDVVFHAQLRAR